MKQVGRDIPRLEVRAKVTGRAEYVHNLGLPGMLYGKVARSTVPHGRIRNIEVSAARDGSTLIISVGDRGSGLAPGEENKVFEKFYRGPRTRPGGLGLGLSIARQLVEAHGGQLVVQNREGGGARFSIRLPVGESMRLPTEATA